MEKQCEVVFEENFAAAKIDIDAIEQNLAKANAARIGQELNGDFLRVTVTAKNQNGEIIGGVYGEIYWNWLHGKALWVNDACRGAGIGAQLLSRLEGMAKAKQLNGLHLETTSFQALNFYLKYGYQVFGQIENKPQGFTWYYLKKQF